jgi:hypothetical protein
VRKTIYFTITALAFRDDSIKDDVTCVKKIFKETEQLGRSGFSAWVAWNNFCQGDLSQYKVKHGAAA